MVSLIVKNAIIWTGDAGNPRATALAVKDGRLVAVGSDAEVEKQKGDKTEVIDAAGQFLMAGLIDGHIHLNIGGAQAAYELPIPPSADVDEVCARVKEWADKLGPNDWVVGGIVGAITLDKLAVENSIKKLDVAAGGRPVLLRDDSLHNRWVNSKCLELMGVTNATPDPVDGTFVKDKDGNLNGLLYESTGAGAEGAFSKSISDPAGRTKGSLLASLEILRRFGITSCQEAYTGELPFKTLLELEKEGKLTSRIVCSMAARVTSLESGPAGEELFKILMPLASPNVIPSFTKLMLDGVPMTRTSAMLGPYKCCHPGGIHGFDDIKVETLWTMPDLMRMLDICYDLNIGAKMHATGDAAVRMVLDAAEEIRGRRGPGPIFQVAHAEYVHPDDLPRFAPLGVVADMSPFIWYPSVLQQSIKKEIMDDVYERSWPTNSFLKHNTIVAAGSDWPVAAPTPDPWTGLQTLITRMNPTGAMEGALVPSEAITTEESMHAFTTGPAKAVGMQGEIGMLKVGYSADFIMLDRNLLECDVGEIFKTQVRKTWFRGAVVYEGK